MLLDNKEISFQFFAYSNSLIPKWIREKQFSETKRRPHYLGKPVIDHLIDCDISCLPGRIYDSKFYAKEVFWQLKNNGAYVLRFFFSKQGNRNIENPLLNAFQTLASSGYWETWAFDNFGIIKTLNFGSQYVPSDGEKPKSFMYVMNGMICVDKT